MLPSIGARQDFNFRNDYMNNLNKTLVNDSERLNRLKKINFFNSDSKQTKDVQPFVEKFDKAKFVPPDFYFVRRYVDGSNVKSHEKKIASYNERKTINQNNVQDRLLTIKRKYLDRQLDYNQMQIKRERSLLLDQYLEAKAANYSFTRFKSNLESETLDGDTKSGKFYRSKYLNNAQSNVDLIPPVPAFDSDLVTKNKSSTSVSEKFVEQQRKYLPSYKRKKDAKRIIASADIDHFIEKGRKVNENNRALCSKFKTHVLAKYRAEYFANNKLLFREFPGLHDLLEQFNNTLSQIHENQNDSSHHKNNNKNDSDNNHHNQNHYVQSSITTHFSN